MVGTLYYSEDFVEEFYRRSVAAAEACFGSFELVLVDDGSPDRAGAIARELVARDPRVKLVELSRNFGHHSAVLAGLAQARGDLVFPIDVDLEEDPAWLESFAAELKRYDVDAVTGVQGLRTGSLFQRLSGTVFYRLFNLLSETKIPANQCTVRLMTRQYVEAVVSMTERNLFLGGNLCWVGFRQRLKLGEKIRRTSPSTYTLAKRFALFVNGLTSFTSYPLIGISLVGLAITSLRRSGLARSRRWAGR